MAMKHTLLLLLTSAVLMAETPKPAPVLNELEKIGLAALMTEQRRIQEAQADLNKRYAAAQDEQCRKHYDGKPCQITMDGRVVLAPDAAMPEVKK